MLFLIYFIFSLSQTRIINWVFSKIDLKVPELLLLPSPNHLLIGYLAENINSYYNIKNRNSYNNHKNKIKQNAPINACLFDTILSKLVGRDADLIASRVELHNWDLVKGAMGNTFVSQDIKSLKPRKNETPQKDVKSLLFSKINMSKELCSLLTYYYSCIFRIWKFIS